MNYISDQMLVSLFLFLSILLALSKGEDDESKKD